MVAISGSFAVEVKRLRLAARLTQEQLAEKAELNVRSVRDLERGHIRHPRPETARAIGTALGLTGPGLATFVEQSRAQYWAGRDEAPEPVTPAPNHLPRRMSRFTGRSSETAELLRALSDPAATPVAAIDGMGGIGKTALAVHVAHELRDRYPDALLYIDLHGHSDRSPLEPDEALGVLLRQLGTPQERIPADPDSLLTAWRSAIAGCRAVLLLDNARDSAQVARLLPPEGPVATLITGRVRLLDLEDVHAVALRPLPPEAALDLLAAVVGARVGADPTGAAELARLCGGLPLALRLVAARLAARPGWAVGDFAVQLGRAGGAVELTVEGRSVEAAFTLSYRQLPDLHRRVLRMLAQHPPAAFDVPAAAAVADLPDLRLAEQVLEHLVDANLLESPARGRYLYHDLIRDYAAGLDDADGVRLAEDRIFDHYLHATAEATLPKEYPFSRHDVDLGPRLTRPRTFEGPADCDAWLKEHWQVTVALVHRADEQGRAELVWRLTRALWAHLFFRGPLATALDLHERAVRASRSFDVSVQVSAKERLASIYVRLGRLDEARALLIDRVLPLRRSLGDPIAIGRTLGNASTLMKFMGRHEDVFRYGYESLEHFAAVSHSAIPQHTYTNIGIAARRTGRYAEALAAHRQYLRLSLHDVAVYGEALDAVAQDHLALGHHRLAALLLTRARAVRLAQGRPFGAAESLSALGTARCALGDIPSALECHLQALDEVREIGERVSEATILNDLVRTLHAAGDVAAARRYAPQAVAAAEAANSRYEIAVAHLGQGRALLASDPTTAADHLRQALEMFTDMGAPERQTAAELLRELTR